MKKIPKWLAMPEPKDAPLGQLDTWDGRMPEDFAADSRAETTEPKGGRS